MTVGTGFDGRTGRYGQVLTGRDGRGRFCRRDGTVGAGFLSTGRDGKGIFPRRDGTVKCNGRYFLDGRGGYKLTVGEIVYGTGRDHGSMLTKVLPSRPVVTVNTVPSINHEKPWKIVKPTPILICYCCCCLHMKPFFLPNDISSTPSVLPDSSS